MRLGIFLTVVFLGILHRALLIPHGVFPPSAYALGHDLPPQCNTNNCKLPNCMCKSTKPPVEDMPQFVMLTFDDAVTRENMKFYRELLENPKRKNKASGCRIAATFFASGDYLDYPSVNELYRMGNEIALHSIR
ncbi:unnamed protein product [Ixodes persulcatus]